VIEDKIIAELEKARKELKTDHYQMSIGQLISLYKENDLKLDPSYQRLFRWEDHQKTKFVESLLLGIPIPPIFVAQKENGLWDIIDGVQRVSTILQLTGDLINKDPLVLSKCQYIPSVEGLTWNELPEEAQRLFKRARISINIILTENSIQSQYELFQRLNTGGINLSDQEVRNCLIIMTDDSFFNSIEAKKKNPDFLKSIKQKKRSVDEEFGMELILRYLIAKNNKYKEDDYNTTTSLLKDFIDRETLNLISDQDFNVDEEIDFMMEVIKFLNTSLDDQAFLKFNSEKDRFEGAFSVSMFEATLAGIATHWDKISKLDNVEIKKSIIELHCDAEFVKATKSGVKALKRLFVLNELSIKYFGNL
jgi:uncharacterized protein with ParB-like and HNH nuclease domain